LRRVTEPKVVSVVVASHARHLRLRWLLNALEEQTFGEPWELVVVHDYDAATAARILDDHPLARAGRLRRHTIEPGTGSPARQRNIGWRMAGAPLIAFTDDDCRPEPGWLAGLVAGAREAAGAVVQGATRPEPLEGAILSAPHVRTLRIEPVNAYCQTCNILYPRELLERLGGFDEIAVAGEDVDLSLRARAAGARIVAAPDAVVFHAVESHTLPGILRANLKWRYLAYLVKQHPELRRQMPLGLFWDDEHAYTSLALAGLLGALADRRLAVLAIPYARRVVRHRARGRRLPALALADVPGQLVRQGAEVAGMLAGSVRYRTLLL
jgi:glycosyltransferase involved in cell wall biosynthesis